MAFFAYLRSRYENTKGLLPNDFTDMAYQRTDSLSISALYSISIHIISALHISRLYDGLFSVLLQGT